MFLVASALSSMGDRLQAEVSVLVEGWHMWVQVQTASAGPVGHAEI